MTEEIKPSWEAATNHLQVKKTVGTGGERSYVGFTITVEHDLAMRFRIVDELPTPVEPDSVTTGDGDEEWTTTEDQVVVSGVVSPGETLETGYVIDGYAPAQYIEFGAPTIAATIRDPSDGEDADESPTTAEPPILEAGAFDDEDPSDDGSDDNPLGAMFAALDEVFDREEYAEFADEVEASFPSDVDFEELLQFADVDADHLDLENETSDGRAEETEDESESVVGALVRELEAADPSEQQVTALREALGVDAARHRTVQIRHLQSRVDDLAAYIDALEAFLDKNGTAEEVLASLQADVDDLASRLDRVEETLAHVDRQQTDLRDAVDRMDRRTATLEETDEQLAAAVASLTSLHGNRIADAEADVAEIKDRQETIVDGLRGAADGE